MKTYIKNALVPVFIFLQFMISIVPLEASQSAANINSSDHFTIKKIIVARPYERQVTLELDHEISYAALIAWFKRDKPKITPRLEEELDWGISYTKRNQISLKGDFKAGQRYSLIFKPGFEIDGKRYKATKSSFVIEPLSTIGFFNQNNVIERNSKQLLHLNLKNIDKFTVNTISIPPVYLPYALDRNVEWEETLKELSSHQEKTQSDDLPDEFKELWGQLTKDKQIFNFQKNYKEKPFSVPLTQRKDSGKGSVQLIKVRSENPELEAESSYKLVRITDIGITYKRSSKNLLIWLTSIQTGTPLSSQKVYALDDQAHIFYLGTTNSDGVIIVRPGVHNAMKVEKGGYTVDEKFFDLSQILALVALSHDDTSFIEIKKGE